LRDRHGVVFPALDYGAIAPRDPPPGPFRTVADVAEVDAARMVRLRRAALAQAPLARAWLALRRAYNSLRT
ncbi:MAG TPA: hypothetical protein VLA78_09855, partial [Paracoccaceae bacterium]|nr:hypothetical protein [Paracoccaceae bacterium]